MRLPKALKIVTIELSEAFIAFYEELQKRWIESLVRQLRWKFSQNYLTPKNLQLFLQKTTCQMFD